MKKTMNMVRIFPLALAIILAAAMPVWAAVPNTHPLRDEMTQNEIGEGMRNLVICIHGWNNPPVNDRYQEVEWAWLVAQLKPQLSTQANSSDPWGLLLYDWHEDADTGGIDFTDLGFDTVVHAAQSALNASAHGISLGPRLPDSLRRVHFIAHSSGAWCAYRAAYSLMSRNPYVVVQITLLDPFIPDEVPGFGGVYPDYSDATIAGMAGWSFGSGPPLLENYYADDSIPGILRGPTLGTQERFSWGQADINLQLQVEWDPNFIHPFGEYMYYDWHSGPILFYGDTISAVAGAPPSRLPPGIDPYIYNFYGWYNSLFWWLQNGYFPKITSQPSKTTSVSSGSPVTLNVQGSGSLPLAYQWFKRGQANPIVGATSSSYTFNASDTTKGDYVVCISNSRGKVFSDLATVSLTTAPTISRVSPPTLTGLPLPQTQRIQIFGSGFTSSSTLTFNDDNQSYDSVPARLTFVNANELDYLIIVGINAAPWTVKVLNGDQESNLGNFLVVSPSSAIILSCSVSPDSGSPGFPLTVSGNANYNNNGGAVPVATVTITIGGQNYTAAVNNGAYSRSINAPSTPGNYTVLVFVSDGIGRTGSTSSSLTVTPNGSTSGYTINGYLTCKSADSADPWMYHDAIDAFGSDDSRFYVWWEMTDITDAHTLYMRLYRPDGTLYSQTDTTTFGQNGGHYDWWRSWWYWDISGYDIADLEGRWAVKLYVDGSYKQTINFTLRYEFKEHLLCKDHQASDPFDPINPTSIFTQTDAKAETWCKLDIVSNPLEMKWQWYEPNGSLYTESTYDSTDPNSQGYDYWGWYKFWGNIGIQGNSAANKCGDWHVEVLIKDAFGNWDNEYTDYFRILEAPLQPPTCVASATPANPIAGQAITLNVAATDNTYLKNVVIHWKDASEHTNPWNDLFAPSLNQNLSIGSLAAGQQIEYWVVASDTSGNLTESIHQTVTVPLVDTTGPALAIASPANNAIVTSASLPVIGTASDNGYGNNGVSSVTVNGVSASGGTASGASTANWSATISLNPGVNTITAVAKDAFDNSAQQQVSVTYNPPVLSITNLTIVSDTTAQFAGFGSVGGNLFMLTSTNLINWQTIGNLTNITGSFQFLFPFSKSENMRFYRVAQAPLGMSFIPAGIFTMGDTLNKMSYALPLHTVYVSAFYLDQYEVTATLWAEVYQWAITHGYSFDNGGSATAGNHPVHAVNWFDAVKWRNARSEMEGRTPAYYTDVGLTARYQSGQVTPYVNWSSGYRLPTEAEWEKAARGGLSGKRFPWGDTITPSQANYYGDTIFLNTSPVGSFVPNGYGLYDMAGNVYEWCWDWYSTEYYSSSPGTDPRGPSSGPNRALRSGCWMDGPSSCETAYRSGFDPTDPISFIPILGFRSLLPADK